MRQAQKRKEKDKVAAVLMLCFCVIALTSIFTVKSNIDKINDSNGNVAVSENTKADEEKPAKTETEEPGVAVSQNVPTIDSLAPQAEAPVGGFIAPVGYAGAEVSLPFSMDKLVYSVTLDQYMTHCGVDIKAPEDSQVLAVREGTVTAVYDDDRFGRSVEISHGGNLVSVYSNLSDGVTVEVGDVVQAGQVIGGVGSSGLCESLEPAHLHFEMLKDGAYMDPAEYITF